MANCYWVAKYDCTFIYSLNASDQQLNNHFRLWRKIFLEKWAFCYSFFSVFCWFQMCHFSVVCCWLEFWCGQWWKLTFLLSNCLFPELTLYVYWNARGVGWPTMEELNTCTQSEINFFYYRRPLCKWFTCACQIYCRSTDDRAYLCFICNTLCFMLRGPFNFIFGRSNKVIKLFL